MDKSNNFCPYFVIECKKPDIQSEELYVYDFSLEIFNKTFKSLLTFSIVCGQTIDFL